MEGKARRRRPPGLVRAISERLRQYIRDYCDNNQSEFGRRVGVAHGTISGWLSPQKPRAPDIGQLVAIAASGRVSLNWLLLEEGPPLMGAATAPQDVMAGLRAQVVAELAAKTGGPSALVEYVVPEPRVLFKLLLDHHLPWIKQLMTPVVAGVSPVPLKGRGRKGSSDAAAELVLREQVERLLASAGGPRLDKLPEGLKELGKTDRHR